MLKEMRKWMGEPNVQWKAMLTVPLIEFQLNSKTGYLTASPPSNRQCWKPWKMGLPRCYMSPHNGENCNASTQPCHPTIIEGWVTACHASMQVYSSSYILAINTYMQWNVLTHLYSQLVRMHMKLCITSYYHALCMNTTAVTFSSYCAKGPGHLQPSSRTQKQSNMYSNTLERLADSRSRMGTWTSLMG